MFVQKEAGPGDNREGQASLYEATQVKVQGHLLLVQALCWALCEAGGPAFKGSQSMAIGVMQYGKGCHGCFSNCCRS